MQCAPLLHLIELFEVEAGGADPPPVVRRRVVRKARCQGAVGSDDEAAAPRPALPGLDDTAEEALHVFEVLHRVDHLIPAAVLLDKPVEQLVDPRPVLLPDVRRVVPVVEEVALLNHGLFVDVVVGGDPILPADLRQLQGVVQVVATDVDVEKDSVAKAPLLPDEIVELGPSTSAGRLLRLRPKTPDALPWHP